MSDTQDSVPTSGESTPNEGEASATPRRHKSRLSLGSVGSDHTHSSSVGEKKSDASIPESSPTGESLTNVAGQLPKTSPLLFTVNDLADTVKRLKVFEGSAQEAIVRRDKEMEVLREKIDQLQTGLDNRSTQVKQLADELFQAKAKMRELCLEGGLKDPLPDVVARVVDENKALREENKDKETRIRMFEEQIEQLRAKGVDVSVPATTEGGEKTMEKADSLESKFRVLDAKLASMKDSSDIQKANLEEARKSVAVRDKQLDSFRQVLRTGERKLSAFLEGKTSGQGDSSGVSDEASDETLVDHFLESINEFRERSWKLEEILHSNYKESVEIQQLQKRISSLEQTIMDLEVRSAEGERLRRTIGAVKEFLRGHTKKESVFEGIDDAELVKLLRTYEKRAQGKLLESEARLEAQRTTTKTIQKEMTDLRRFLKFSLLLLKDESHKALPEEEEPISDAELEELWTTLNELHDTHADEMEAKMHDVAVLVSEVEHLNAILSQKLDLLDEKREESEVKNEQMHQLQKKLRGAFRLVHEERVVFAELMEMVLSTQKEVQSREVRLKKMRKERDKKDELRQEKQSKRFESEDMEQMHNQLTDSRVTAMREAMKEEEARSMHGASLMLRNQIMILQAKSDFTFESLNLKDQSRRFLEEELRAALDLCGVYQDLSRLYRENAKTSVDALNRFYRVVQSEINRKLADLGKDDNIPLIMSSVVLKHQRDRSDRQIGGRNVPLPPLPVSVADSHHEDATTPRGGGGSGAAQSRVSTAQSPYSNWSAAQGSPQTPQGAQPSHVPVTSPSRPDDSTVGTRQTYRGDDMFFVSPQTPQEGEAVSGKGSFVADCESLSWEWSRCAEDESVFKPIEGETGPSYVPTLDDVSCVLMACARSSDVSVTSATNPVQVGFPTFRNIKVQGGPYHTGLLTLHVTYIGGVQGKSQIQWMRQSKGSDRFRPIVGSTSLSYHPSVDDLDSQLQVNLTPVRDDDVVGATKLIRIPEDFLRIDPKVKEAAEKATPEGVFRLKVLEKRPNQKDKFREIIATPKGLQIKGMGSRLKAKIPYDNDVTILIPAACIQSGRFNLVTAKHTMQFSAETGLDRDVAVLTIRRLMEIFLSDEK